MSNPSRKCPPSPRRTSRFFHHRRSHTPRRRYRLSVSFMPRHLRCSSTSNPSRGPGNPVDTAPSFPADASEESGIPHVPMTTAQLQPRLRVARKMHPFMPQPHTHFLPNELYNIRIHVWPGGAPAPSSSTTLSLPTTFRNGAGQAERQKKLLLVAVAYRSPRIILRDINIVGLVDGDGLWKGPHGHGVALPRARLCETTTNTNTIMRNLLDLPTPRSTLTTLL
uniref:Uncharacterized protein n=1 Tax=Mycena chlorophos TaxID=658473 RepID=A0ABQ0KVW1_MYCCL|nr:predicted protein [Mycena chlorophos]